MNYGCGSSFWARIANPRYREIIASYDPDWGSMIDGDKLVDDIKDLVDEYDPIMESIFGPKPVPEPETAEPDDEDETNESNAATTATGTTQSVIVESTASSTPDEPEKEEIVAPVANTTYTATAPSTGTAKENAYYIEYLGKKYYTGGKINIPYARDLMPTFEMKTVPADAKVTYSIYEPGKQEMWRGYDSSSAKSSLPIEDSKVANNLLKQDLQAEATSIEGNPKVKVLVEKVVMPFTQNKLTVTDIKNTKRFASAGKTLYFINKPLKTDYKKIKLEATLSQTDDNKIPKENIKWKINDKENEYKEGDTEFTIPITDKIENATFTNSAGFPTMTDKTVRVKWMDKYDNQVDYTNSLKGITEIFGIVNYVSRRVGTFLPCEIYLPNISQMISNKTFHVGYNTTNDEEEDNRHISDKKIISFKLISPKIAGFSCEKNLGIKFWIIDLTAGKVFFDLNLSSNLTFNRETQIIYETKKETSRMFMSGGLELGLDVGAKLGKKWNVSGIDVGLEASTIVNASGGGKAEYPFKGNKDIIGFYCYLNPVKVKITGEAVAGIYSKQLSWDFLLWDVHYETDPFTINLKELVNKK